MQHTHKRMGAPCKPPELRMIQKSGRMPQELWDKIDDNGGWAWLRELVRRAKPRKDQSA